MTCTYSLAHSIHTGAKNEVAVFEDKNLFQLLGHDDSIHDMLLRNDTLVTCSSDKTIKIWDLQSKTCVNTLHGEYLYFL